MPFWKNIGSGKEKGGGSSAGSGCGQNRRYDGPFVNNIISCLLIKSSNSSYECDTYLQGL